mgnify:CR=1 FL=1
MALFALSGGRIVPAQAVELDGTSATEVLGALRERALDIVGVPLFPIVWEQADRQPGESHLLTMDSAGNTVIVSIRAHFSAVSLFEALSLAGRYSSMSRREIVAMYPGGQAAFDSAWQTFRESSPATASAGARMVVVTLRADDDLFPVITTLSEGVRVLEARVYGSGTQRYLSVDPCHKRAVNSTTDARTVAPRPAAAPAVAAAVAAEAGDVVLAANKPAERVLAGAVAVKLNAAFLPGLKSVKDGAAELSRYGGLSFESVTFDSPVVAVLDGGAEADGTLRAGAEVGSVEQGSPAANAGLKQGDVITAINGKTTSQAAALTGFVRQYSAGDTVKLTVIRNGEKKEIEVTLAEKTS